MFIQHSRPSDGHGYQRPPHAVLPACIAAGAIGLSTLSASAAISSADREFAVGTARYVATDQQFAQRRITDHSAANTELQQIAKH
jgi:hypothetical protein